MKPFVKWAGGKSKLVPELRAHLLRWLRAPEHNTREFDYVEPFLGGGAFALDLMSNPLWRASGHALHWPRFFLSDINRDLVNVWTALRDESDSVVSTLSAWTEQYNSHFCIKPAMYDRLRRQYNHDYGLYSQLNASRAALFLFLNKTCFNGLYRVNNKGEFNVGWNKESSISFDFENLKAIGERLRQGDVTIGSWDWENAIGQLGASSKPTFVYCDSPYDVSPGTAGFTKYDKGGFGLKSQAMLEARMRELANAGCGVMLSNADTSYIRELYRSERGWKLHETSRAGTMSSKGSGRQRVGELIITNF